MTGFRSTVKPPQGSHFVFALPSRTRLFSLYPRMPHSISPAYFAPIVMVNRTPSPPYSPPWTHPVPISRYFHCRPTQLPLPHLYTIHPSLELRMLRDPRHPIPLLAASATASMRPFFILRFAVEHNRQTGAKIHFFSADDA